MQTGLTVGLLSLAVVKSFIGILLTIPRNLSWDSTTRLAAACPRIIGILAVEHGNSTAAVEGGELHVTVIRAGVD
jgi:hypothetical protein